MSQYKVGDKVILRKGTIIENTFEVVAYESPGRNYNMQNAIEETGTLIKRESAFQNAWKVQLPNGEIWIYLEEWFQEYQPEKQLTLQERICKKAIEMENKFKQAQIKKGNKICA